MKQHCWPVACLLFLAACGSPHGKPGAEFSSAQSNTEQELVMPALPKPENLIEFYAGEVTTNHFFIDPLSLRIDREGALFYTLVIKTSGGASNISHESMRCDRKQVRLYAIGRDDGSWSKARISEWRDIETKIVNPHHAELSRNFFCPGSRPLDSPAEGVDALRRGKHPDVQMYEKP